MPDSQNVNKWYMMATCLPENAETGKVKIKWSSTMTNKDIMRIATEQSALEANCSPEGLFPAVKT